TYKDITDKDTTDEESNFMVTYLAFAACICSLHLQLAFATKHLQLAFANKHLKLAFASKHLQLTFAG
ncbi:hypothetical protein Tco_0440498, partial [Tanacetum coccineum]